MHAPHLQREQLRRSLTDIPRPLDAVGVKIDMGVIALDLLHLNPS
jgi:hypothetical protein